MECLSVVEQLVKMATGAWTEQGRKFTFTFGATGATPALAGI